MPPNLPKQWTLLKEDLTVFTWIFLKSVLWGKTGTISYMDDKVSLHAVQ